MKKIQKRIGEILIQKKIITEAQLHDALLAQKLSDGFIGKILVNKGVIAERQLREALSEQFDIPLVDLKTEYIDMELSPKFSSTLILDHKCFPLRQDDNSITVAMTNPLNAVAIAKFEEEANPRKVNWVLVSEEDLKGLIQKYRQAISQNIQRLLRKDKKT